MTIVFDLSIRYLSPLDPLCTAFAAVLPSLLAAFASVLTWSRLSSKASP